MKRILSSVLILLMLISIRPSFAFAEDFGSKSDDELQEMYTAIRQELTSRGYRAENKKVLIDYNGVQIYVNGDFSVEKEWYGPVLKLPIVVANNSQMNICVQLRNPSVNGWGCETMFSPEIPAGKKVKDNLEFELKETDVESLSDFEDVEFYFHVFDNDNWMVDGFDSDIVHLYAG